MIKFHTSINTVCKTWKKTEYSVFFSEKNLLQKCMLNKCDRPKLICFIIKCSNAQEDQMEDTLKIF